MPTPETGGYSYPTHTQHNAAPYHPQSTVPSSPWAGSRADDSCQWQSSPPHAQTGGNFPPYSQSQDYGRGLVAMAGEAPWMPQTSRSTHGPLPQSYPYPVPQPQHAATMPPQSFPQFSSSPPRNVDFRGGFCTAEPQSYIGGPPTHCPQDYGYPAEMVAGEEDPPTSSRRNMTLSRIDAVADTVAVLRHGTAGFRVPVENGDPRGKQSSTQTGAQTITKPKPGSSNKLPWPYHEQASVCDPQHETLPPTRGAF